MKAKFTLILVLFIHSLSGQTNKTNESPIRIGTQFILQSKILNEGVKVNVHYPDGYNSSDTTTYPVVYLLDGALDEDFLHIVGLYQFYSFEWINFVKRSIVVGIVTTDRKRDYTFKTGIKSDSLKYLTSGHSNKFIDYIEKELQPTISKKCKVNNSRTLIGQSLGGLLATEILFKKPNLFTNYYIVSPSIWWDNGSILSNSDTALKDINSKTIIYIAVGKEGLTPTEKSRVMEVDANLLKEKIEQTQNKNVFVYFDYLPNENHTTILHQAINNAIRLAHCRN